jgi:hypothetical protein
MFGARLQQNYALCVGVNHKRSLLNVAKVTQRMQPIVAAFAAAKAMSKSERPMAADGCTGMVVTPYADAPMP